MNVIDDSSINLILEPLYMNKSSEMGEEDRKWRVRIDLKVENRKMKFGGLLVAVLVFSFLGVYSYTANNEKGNSMVADAGQTFSLVNPVFAQSASSETTFLEEEAGMSIYINIGRSIDLAVAKTVYRTIEKETSNYTVGSIALPGLPESEDVHGFVHKDGWIVVYYLKAEPVGKIIDWNYWSGGKLTKNKVQVGLEQMGNALGASVTGAKYYHFQYPYANKSMIIMETLEVGGEDSFNITIPLEFTVYERSWSHYAEYTWYGYYPSYLKIDGNTINTITTDDQTKYGQLTVAQLSPGMVHTVSVSGQYSGKLYGVSIALAYQEP